MLTTTEPTEKTACSFHNRKAIRPTWCDMKLYFVFSKYMSL